MSLFQESYLHVFNTVSSQCDAHITSIRIKMYKCTNISHWRQMCM